MGTRARIGYNAGNLKNGAYGRHVLGSTTIHQSTRNYDRGCTMTGVVLRCVEGRCTRPVDGYQL